MDGDAVGSAVVGVELGSVVGETVGATVSQVTFNTYCVSLLVDSPVIVNR